MIQETKDIELNTKNSKNDIIIKPELNTDNSSINVNNKANNYISPSIVRQDNIGKQNEPFKLNTQLM